MVPRLLIVLVSAVLAGCAITPQQSNPMQQKAAKVIYMAANGDYGEPHASGIVLVRSNDDMATCRLAWRWKSGVQPQPVIQYSYEHDFGRALYVGVPWLAEAKAGQMELPEIPNEHVFWEHCGVGIFSQLDPYSLLAKDFVFIGNRAMAKARMRRP